jgi:hypothetical protein
MTDMGVNERLDALTAAQEQLAESLLFLTGRLDMLSQQVLRMSETVMRGFTAVTTAQGDLRRRLAAMETQVANLEAANEKPS